MTPKAPSFLAHLRSILLLPVMVTLVVPFVIRDTLPAVLPRENWLRAIGLLLMAAGLLLFGRTIGLFNAVGRGTLAPWEPTQRLVVVGPYQYCRNPMITGVWAVLIGEGLWLGSTAILAWATLFFLINTTYFWLKEEPDLHKRFGAPYQHYKQHVPRWIPSRKPYVQPEAPDR